MSIAAFALDGKRALVAGSGSPVGGAIAAALREAGARIVEVSPSEPLDADRVVADAAGVLGGLDVLISCLGQPSAAPFEQVRDAQWDRVVESNLSSPARLIRAAGRWMLEHGGGRIVQVVSLVGERGVPNTGPYAACQAGLIQLVRTLALEWARRNIRVNAIGLGWMEDDPLVGGAAEWLTRYIPARRLGRADEVGALAVYLAADAADMMNGQVVWVDGAVLSHA